MATKAAKAPRGPASVARSAAPKGVRYDVEALFVAYYLIGPERSLEALRSFAAKAWPGAKAPALNTLKTYSARGGWVARVEDLDRQRAEQVAARPLETIVEMNERQADLGRIMQELAASRVADILKTPQAISALNFRDAAALAREGVRIERLAVGEVTSRQEVLVTTYNRVVVPILQLFQTVVTDLPEEVRRSIVERFANGVDAIRDEHMTLALDRGHE